MKSQSKIYSISKWKKSPMRIIILLLYLFVFSFYTQAQNGWRGLIPLKSTMEDAEKLLGQQTNKGVRGYGIYKNENEKVAIWYASGRCIKTNQAQWKVPKNTITRITVFPNKSVLLPSLKIDLKEFERIIIPIHTDRAYYVSKDKSQENFVRIDEGNEEIVLMTFLPGENNAQYRCSNPS